MQENYSNRNNRWHLSVGLCTQTPRWFGCRDPHFAVIHCSLSQMHRVFSASAATFKLVWYLWKVIFASQGRAAERDLHLQPPMSLTTSGRRHHQPLVSQTEKEYVLASLPNCNCIILKFEIVFASFSFNVINKSFRSFCLKRRNNMFLALFVPK